MKRILDFAPLILLTILTGFSGYAVFFQSREMSSLRAKLDKDLRTMNLSIKESHATIRELNRDKSILVTQLEDCAEVRHGIDGQLQRIETAVGKLKDKKK